LLEGDAQGGRKNGKWQRANGKWFVPFEICRLTFAI
jgi:hypothetical protein